MLLIYVPPYTFFRTPRPHYRQYTERKVASYRGMRLTDRRPVAWLVSLFVNFAELKWKARGNETVYLEGTAPLT